MPALIDYDLPNAGGGGFYEWETDPQITTDPSGFDIVKATICFKGTAAQLFALFALGAQNCPDLTSKPLYYAGPKVQEARFGFQVADLEWVGKADALPTHPAGIFAIGLSSGMRALSFEFAQTTAEVDFPQERGGALIVAKHPDKQPAASDAYYRTVKSWVTGALTDVGQPWRVRMIGRKFSATLRGITLSDYGILTKPPKLLAAGAVGNPYTGDASTINWQQFPDPLVTEADGVSATGGWLCRNYQVRRDYQLGTKSLKAWTADYEWIDRYGP